MHAITELEISVVCPKGSTCGKDMITGKFRKVFLRAHWVCPNCSETSFNLETTVNGSLYFNPQGVTVVDVAGVPVATAAAFPSNATTTIPTAPCAEGYLIVWVTDGSGRAIKGDVLIGDAIIRNPSTMTNNSARAYNAIPIQASPDLATLAETDVDGDGNLDFNGSEYKMVTGKIFGTVRYVNPTFVTEGFVFTDLTLLTLDVDSNLFSHPVTTVALNFYTDDEELIDTAIVFQCWVEQRLDLINSSLTAQRMGRKGLVESTSAEQTAIIPFAPGVPVTILGLLETSEFTAVAVNAVLARDYAYSLYNDSTPLATTFQP